MESGTRYGRSLRHFDGPKSFYEWIDEINIGDDVDETGMLLYSYLLYYNFLFLDRSVNNNFRFEPLDINHVEFYASENAKNHRTDKYDLVSDKKIPVLRRSNSFYMAISAHQRPIDPKKDKLNVVFEFGNYLTIITYYNS